MWLIYSAAYCHIACTHHAAWRQQHGLVNDTIEQRFTSAGVRRSSGSPQLCGQMSHPLSGAVRGESRGPTSYLVAIGAVLVALVAARCALAMSLATRAGLRVAFALACTGDHALSTNHRLRASRCAESYFLWQAAPVLKYLIKAHKQWRPARQRLHVGWVVFILQHSISTPARQASR